MRKIFNLPRNLRTGVLLAFATALISGVSIYVNKFAVSAVPDAVLFTTLKNTLVGIAIITVILVAQSARKETRQAISKLTKRQAVGLIGLAVIGGSIPFALFFTGLKLASAPSAALIQKSLFIWVALLAVPLLHEKLGKWVVAGLAVLLAGQLLSNLPKAWGWGFGENLILIATMLWAFETILAKRLLGALPTALVATARMAGGALVLWLVLIANHQATQVLAMNANQWMWVAITSAFLFGYVMTWYAALKRAPATVVTSVLTIGAVITVGLTAVLEGKGVDLLPGVGLVLTTAGVAFIAGYWFMAWRRDARATAAE